MEEIKNEVFEEIIEEVAESESKISLIALGIGAAALVGTVAAVKAIKNHPVKNLKIFKKHSDEDVTYTEDLGCVPEEYVE